MEQSHRRFYRFFKADTCATKLKLPPRVQFILPSVVTLKDKHSNIWRMRAKKVGGSWYLLDGWKKFAKDNSLTNYDMIRFKYTNNGSFNVIIYGLSGRGEKEVGHPTAEKEVGHPTAEIEQEAIPGINGEQRRGERKTDLLIVKEMISEGKVPEPDGIYFVTRINATSMNELHIPNDLIVDGKPELPPEIKLLDPEGYLYTVWYREWNEGSSFYKGGWSRLLRRNDIMDNDICICEFNDNIKPTRIYVSFLRAVAI